MLPSHLGSPIPYSASFILILHLLTKNIILHNNMQPNLNSSDFYEILGCPRSADESTLKKAYRKLAVKYHPDKNPDNEESTKNFQKISEAYATLSDPKKRKLYDSYGKEAANQSDQMPDGAMPGGFGGFRPGAGGMPGGFGGGSNQMSPEEAQAFFAQAFGGADPFGGLFGGMGGGMPGMGGMGGAPNIQFSMGGGAPGASFGAGGGHDPFSVMFQQGGMGGMGGMGGGMPRRAASKPAPPRYDAIPPGTVVSLKGLVNASDRNGDRGVVKQYVPQSGRYVVELEDAVDTMSVKPSNLLQHVQVRIHDIQSQPELNGRTGTIITWNPTKERYSIYVAAMSKVVSLKPGNVVLETGTVAQVAGLSSRPELNGRWGTIKEWDRGTNKYDVQLSPQQVIRVKVENMRV